MPTMTFTLKEESAIFTLLCQMIADNKYLTDVELALYHKFRAAGWEDLIAKRTDILAEMLAEEETK